MREEVPWAITQILSCKNYVKDHAQYYCSNKSCLHEKRVPFTCKHRMCNSCGKVASDKWVAKQKQVLPKCSFQHITFTMPCELWPIFERNRHLLNKLPTLAAQSVLKLAKKKNIKPGIFTALHTFGRDLKWNCHVHLSVTRGGLSHDLSEWKNIYFPAKNLMSVWRHGVTKLLRDAFKENKLNLPHNIAPYFLNKLLNEQYQRHWRIHCAKKQNNAEKDIAYLGKYIKRPPLANSRLVHYSGKDVLFKYFDHKSGTHKKLHLDVYSFLKRFTQHIPPKHFKIIRYYGFLANSVRTRYLPLVYKLTNSIFDFVHHVSWQTIHRKTFGTSPLDCILCNDKLKFGFVVVGMTNKELHQHHSKLALQKIIRR